MLRCLTLLLLFCFINNGAASRSVSGVKRGSVILPCELEDKKILHTGLSRPSEIIPVCETEDCNGRVFKEGSCDIIIRDLRLRDAGKYYLYVYYTDDQREVKQQLPEYQLHIQDEISVNTGEELKMDVLLINAEKVDTNSSGQWTEVWTRGHGVSSDRLTDSDGNLTINEFTSTDAGTYRVLDSEGQILISITVSVTHSPSVSSGQTSEMNAETHTPAVEMWIWPVAVSSVVLLVLAAVIIAVKKCKNRCRNIQYTTLSKPESNGNEMLAV